MKRILKILGIVLIIMTITLATTACDNGNGDSSGTQTKTYTVTFDADNGSEPTTQTVTEGGTAAKPANPAKNGYGFAYWFNTATDTEWDFNTPITANLSLKAKWNINQYTVTFDADNGSESTTQTVTEGSTANKPADPSKTYTPIGLYAGTPPTSYTFVEWQKSDGSAWNFTADTVTADITLTAQWTVPTLIDLTDETGNNIVEKSVSYVNANGGSEYTLVLGEDVSNVAPQTLDQDDTTLTITSDGNTERKISLGNNGILFRVGGTTTDYITYYPRSAKLVLDGHITLKGKIDNNASLVAVVSGGSLELKGNAKITGNVNDGIDSSDVDWSTGIVTWGGSGTGEGVIITMSGNAEISDNSTPNTGNVFGGIMIGDYTTFTMNENAVIKNNSGWRGGGVHIAGNNGAVFIMNGGKISGNTVTSDGGGVYVNTGATFIMNGGEITDNTSDGDGGGVYNMGTFTVASEQVKAGIYDNIATRQFYIQVYTLTGGFTVGGEPANSF